ncbi:MAG: metallophosphoesterase [Gemmatirosa sp.]
MKERPDGEPASRPTPPRPRASTGDGVAREAIVAFSLAPADAAPPEPAAPPALLPVVEVETLDWGAVRAAADPRAVRERAHTIVERAEALLDREGGAGLLFDADRATPDDRAIHVRELAPETPLWFVGDLHGDLLSLEAALALARTTDTDRPPHLVFLGDLFDDGGYGLEVLLRVLELLVESPATTCVVAGNHDEALAFDGARFTASVSPSDFADRLNAAHDEWATRAGALAVRLFARAPRALFLPDGLLVSHGGFPLVDLHAELEASGDWNDPRALTDFVWTRAHPKARKKLPNRASRGSQFGREDFAAFCALATRLGRPVTHMVRGHDHVEERWEAYPAYAEHPVLTIVALSRRLEREAFGPYVRVPTVARWVAGALPQVHRLHVPEADVRALYPEATAETSMTPDDAPAPPDGEPTP